MPKHLYGVLGDVHLPWCDLRNLTLALEVMQDQGVQTLILNGDIGDFYAVNAHGPKHPDIKTTLDDEIYSIHQFLDRVQKMFPEIIFVAGNHEYRLDRFVMANCPVFWNHLTIEKMLDLEKRNMVYIPYNERYQIGNAQVFAQHSPPSYSQNAATTSIMKKMDQDHIWGCTHRPDISFRKGSSGKIYTSVMNGWFGSTGVFNQMKRDMPENKRVFSFMKNHDQWGCSFSIVGVKDELHWIDHIVIKDYSCIIGGNLYEG